MRILSSISVVIFVFFASNAIAAPQIYALDANRSDVVFTWRFGEEFINGRIPVDAANVVLDLDAINRSDVRVALDARAAQAGFLFATQALRGPHVFDAESFPQITFQSENFRFDGNAVEVDGAVTIRGVTRPMVMQATLYRQQGTEPSDRDHLAIQLVGAVNRHDFGASGFANQVGPEVEFRILAYIDRVP
ncbi:MAG: YceI family protein [Pseudomonadota bacterium]